MLYISCIYVLSFQRKPYLRRLNRLNRLKHQQHSEVHHFSQKKKRKRMRKYEREILCETSILVQVTKAQVYYIEEYLQQIKLVVISASCQQPVYRFQDCYKMSLVQKLQTNICYTYLILLCLSQFCNYLVCFGKAIQFFLNLYDIAEVIARFNI